MFLLEKFVYTKWNFEMKVCYIRDACTDAHTDAKKMLLNGPSLEDLINCNENISKLANLHALLLPVQATVLSKLWKVLVSKKETELTAVCTVFCEIKKNIFSTCEICLIYSNSCALFSTLLWQLWMYFYTFVLTLCCH